MHILALCSGLNRKREGNGRVSGYFQGLLDKVYSVCISAGCGSRRVHVYPFCNRNSYLLPYRPELHCSASVSVAK